MNGHIIQKMYIDTRIHARARTHGVWDEKDVICHSEQRPELRYKQCTDCIFPAYCGQQRTAFGQRGKRDLKKEKGTMKRKHKYAHNKRTYTDTYMIRTQINVLLLKTYSNTQRNTCKHT